MQNISRHISQDIPLFHCDDCQTNPDDPPIWYFQFFVKSLDSISFFCSLQVWVHGLPDYFDRNCLGLSYIWLCKFSCKKNNCLLVLYMVFLLFKTIGCLFYIRLCKFSSFLKQLVVNFENILQVLKPLLGPFLARSVMPPINAILDKYCIWSHLYLITSCFFLHCVSYIFTVTINMMIPGLPQQVFHPFLMIATYFHHQQFHWHDHKKTIITLDMDRLLDLWFFNLLLYVLVIAAFATFLILDTKVVALD